MTADRAIEFAPPHERLQPGAVALAVAAHLALLAALTWGVSWKQQADIPAVEAELWSALPRQAAPAAVEPPPPPAPAPAPPEPKPAPAPPPKPDAQAERDAEIAVERDKKKREEERQRLKLEEQRKEKEREEAKREADAKKKKERDEAERKEAAAEKAEALKKQQAADAKKKTEAADAAKKLEAQRQENLKRMAGLAGATGGPTATGDAQRSSGPSGTYGGKVAAKVKPNIVFTDDIAGNPVAEVEVRAAPDGTITGVRLTKSSGNKGWDDAVVRALQKTESLPRDTDGRVPSPIVIGFRPRDVGL